MHLNNVRDARRRIDERRFGRHEEVRHRQEYEQEYGNPDSALEPLNTGNIVDHGVDYPEGPHHSRGHSEHSSGPVGSKSLGWSPTRDG